MSLKFCKDKGEFSPKKLLGDLKTTNKKKLRGNPRIERFWHGKLAGLNPSSL